MEFSRNDTKVIKGLAMVLMLYHHLFAFPDRIPFGITYKSIAIYEGYTLSYWIGTFGKICVALFVFLSGYGTYIAAKKTTESENAFIANKIKKLYFVYWKVCAVFIPICMFFDVKQVTKNAYDLIGNVLGIHISYNLEWWFFPPFILLIILFPVTKKMLSSKDSFWQDAVVILALNTFICYVLPGIYGYPWAANLSQSLFWGKFSETLQMLPGFLVGCVCAKYDLLSKAKTRFKSNVINTIGALVVTVVIFYMRGAMGGAGDFIFAPLYAVSGINLLSSLCCFNCGMVMYH